jgi:hypothetical protein
MPIIGSFFLGRALAYRDSGLMAFRTKEGRVVHLNFRDMARDKFDLLASANLAHTLPATFLALLAGPYLACAIRRLRHDMCSDSANLSRIPLDDEGARWMASRTFCRVPETLKTLDLSGGACSPTSYGLLKPLTRLHCPMQLPRLENLDLSNNPLNATAIGMLACAMACDYHCLNRLRRLNLRNTGLDSDGLTTLARVFEKLSDSLAALDISSNDWKRKGLEAFMDHGHHLRGLTTLDLSDVRFIDTPAYIRFAKWIRHDSKWMYIERVVLNPSSRPDSRTPSIYEVDRVVRAAIEFRKAELAWTTACARLQAYCD